MDNSADILAELQTLAADVNAIRNGEYDPPKGANQTPHRIRATPDDIYSRLGTVIGLLERQNNLLYNIGLNAVDGNDEFWNRQNREY